MSDFKRLIEALNAELEEPYRFTLDKIISSANFDTKVLGYADSVLDDWANIPPNLKSKIVTSNTCLSINKWINRRLWMDILNNLLEDKTLSLQTRLVRVRIAINMSLKMAYPLNEEEKAEIIKEYEDKFSNPYRAAERGLIDEVIMPRDIRTMTETCWWFAMNLRKKIQLTSCQSILKPYGIRKTVVIFITIKNWQIENL